ncbi:mitochondrial inner membrane protease ATP23 homolog isoform X3 [Cervus elaphus]|uniref:mitochondrial inner membrane protease ATP23 homolog isoform X3 n=1 Tax=Cervus elaphus TaxID=9860 RepID=UPI001CC2F4B3|nr:mitochondrial inner membrane protease ATP23 homolog isoform X3 [Cervus elaphus]
MIDPYVKLLLDAMKHSGCAVNKDRHFACEDCNGNVSGGFDAAVSQIVLCQNNIRNQAHMNRVVTHELIHAFDHCRAHVNWFTNVRHLACSEVRAANLSGDCSLLNEIFRLHFGLKQHHQKTFKFCVVSCCLQGRFPSQRKSYPAMVSYEKLRERKTCVRDRAIRSILAVRNISKEVAQKAVDEVFESCFNDHEPFGRIPHNKTYARYAHRDFQNRDRYYSNI